MANEKIEKAVRKKNFGMLQKLSQGRDAAVRTEAIEAMGRLGGNDSFNELTGLLRSPSAPTRAAAADGLAALGDEKARAFLEHQLEREDDPIVQAKIRDALASSRSAR